MRFRVRPKSSLEIPSATGQDRNRVRKHPAPAAPIVVAKRRGRAPAHIPDAWADLEWETHRDAQGAVQSHPFGMTLEEIGACMGITRERVRQIENSALSKLRENTGGDVSWIGKLTMPTPNCKRCDEPFVRETGRQVMCKTCEATRRRKRPATVAA
jgi:hypothetical protein